MATRGPKRVVVDLTPKQLRAQAAARAKAVKEANDKRIAALEERVRELEARPIFPSITIMPAIFVPPIEPVPLPWTPWNPYSPFPYLPDPFVVVGDHTVQPFLAPGTFIC